MQAKAQLEPVGGLAGGAACSIFLAWTLATLTAKLEHSDPERCDLWHTFLQIPFLFAKQGQESLLPALALPPARSFLSGLTPGKEEEQ